MMKARRYKDMIDAYACLLAADDAERYALEYQKRLCNLRDSIAKKSGIDAEVVQDVFETYARELRDSTQKAAE